MHLQCYTLAYNLYKYLHTSSQQAFHYHKVELQSCDFTKSTQKAKKKMRTGLRNWDFDYHGLSAVVRGVDRRYLNQYHVCWIRKYTKIGSFVERSVYNSFAITCLLTFDSSCLFFLLLTLGNGAESWRQDHLMPEALSSEWKTLLDKYFCFMQTLLIGVFAAFIGSSEVADFCHSCIKFNTGLVGLLCCTWKSFVFLFLYHTWVKLINKWMNSQ